MDISETAHQSCASLKFGPSEICQSNNILTSCTVQSQSYLTQRIGEAVIK